MNNSSQPTELTNNANLSVAASDVDGNISVVSGPRSPANKGQDNVKLQPIVHRVTRTLLADNQGTMACMAEVELVGIMVDIMN